ncbi:S-layer protein/ peptidoglycan endo-beta-N-acetylglucosaminidase [Peptoclostridium acidaminophilum DSM 3953]|uniref:S-layer protein/ peptidoglycan endo-beta-N-acetylglucosaminidase n=1 Tax=Peptoclostridium acidaminophilum DSM 3953 TaxID=1286171 RepID=W8U5K7_PEPAC|nr:glucosaminidase domain-containing protein [Peptoclostridium acidaminophilum]AHM56211.1 S-layer protein/ peptidoglycan endo-beta-N-acetylglucosaminidase [Peptoclostridium acidaminophilum DSM 3953]
MVKGAIYIMAAAFCLFAVTLVADLMSGLYEKKLWAATEKPPFGYYDSSAASEYQKTYQLSTDISDFSKKASLLKVDLENIASVAERAATQESAKAQEEPVKAMTSSQYLKVDLSQTSGYTKSDIDKLIEGTSLEGLGEYVIAAEHLHGVNALFIISVAQHESQYGQSKISRMKNNLFGIGAYDATPYRSAKRFASKQESIMKFASIISTGYFSKGALSVERIGAKYASDKNWAAAVASLMHKNAVRIELESGF